MSIHYDLFIVTGPTTNHNALLWMSYDILMHWLDVYNESGLSTWECHLQRSSCKFQWRSIEVIVSCSIHWCVSYQKKVSRAGTSSYIPQLLWDVVTCPCPWCLLLAQRSWIMGMHDDVIKWKQFPRCWPCVRIIHRSPVNSHHKGQWRGAYDVFFHLCLNKRLSKQWWGRWFETPSRSLWRHCNGLRLVLDTHWRHIEYCL